MTDPHDAPPQDRTQDFVPAGVGSEQPTLPPEETTPAIGADPGRRFGDYELLEEIARGGMGVVFKARQLSLNRVVALKMILAGELAGKEEIARFRAEAEAAANLDHPHIVPIHEVGEYQGQQYFSMKYIDGGSLASVLTRAPGVRPSIRDLVALLVPVCHAVHHAHQRGILHRDLKPGNILLDPTGQPHVTDFGLAKKVEGDSGMTRSGAIVGTPSYMAPEQAAAKKGLTTAVDVYALGAILYEMLTGQPPFRADTPLDTLLQVLDREPTPPSRINPGVDRDLATVALKCLEKDPARRYDSAAALAVDLERWLRGEPITARPVGKLERGWRWCRRNPVVALLLIAVAVALLAGSVVSTWFAFDAAEQRGVAERETQEARKNEAESVQMLGQTLLARARAARLAGERAQALEALEVLQSLPIKPPVEQVRQEAIQIITSPGLKRIAKLGRIHTIMSGGGPTFQFSADGKFLAVPGHYGKSAAHLGLKDPKFVTGFADGLQVFDVASGQVIGQLECNYHGYAWHPTQPLLAAAAQEQGQWQVLLWEPQTNQIRQKLPGYSPVKFSPSGNLLASQEGATGELRVWDWAQHQVLPFHTPGEALGFLSPGEELVVKTYDRVRQRHTVQVWDIHTGKELLAAVKDRELLAWSDNGAWLAVASHKDPAKQMEIWSAQTRELMTTLPRPTGKAPEPVLFNNLPYQLAIVYPPEFQTVVLYDLLLKLVTGRLVKPGMWGPVMQSGAFSPHGSFLATQDSAGPADIRIWDVSSGKLLATLYDQRQPVWSKDGRRLAVYGTDAPSLTSLTDSHIWVYEVTPPVLNCQVDRAVNTLSFSTSGQEFYAPAAAWELMGKVWDLRLYQSWVLHCPNEQFLANHGHLWSIQANYQFHPERQQHGVRDLVLRRYYPDDMPKVAKTLTRPLDEIGALCSAALSADGQRLILVWDQQQRREVRPDGSFNLTNRGLLEIWDLKEMRRLHRWEDIFRTGNILVQAVSPDHRSGVIGDSRGLRRWSLDDHSFTELCEFRTETQPGQATVHAVRALCYSPDGQAICCALANNTVQVVETATGRTRHILQGHTAEVLALAVTPDSKTLATAGLDKTIRLWNFVTGKELARWTTHEAAITALAFRPDGLTLVSGDKAGAIKLWHLPTMRHELRTLGLDWQE